MPTESPLISKESFPPPSFIKGEKVRIKPSCVKISSSHNVLQGKILIVDECETKNLGNINAEIVRFQETEGVQNPYLAEYFKKIEDEEINP